MTECVVEGDILTFECPHCNGGITVAINDVACGIFRHGYYFVKEGEIIKLTDQIDPHGSKEVCDALATSGKVIGCCRPFKVIKDEKNYRVEICEYI